MNNNVGANYAEEAFFLMDANALGSCNTWQTQAACYDGSVACGAATSSQNALGDQHTMHVIGAGLRSHQHDRYSSFAQIFSTVSITDSFTTGSSRRSIQAFSQHSTFLFGLLIL